ncbi:hypothetical protein BLA29_012507, partial [Euroglyphus maynei]
MSPGPMQSMATGTATEQQFQFIQHSSSPQYAMSDSSMSPSRPPSQYQYNQSSNHVLPSAYTSSPSNSYEATPITHHHHHHHHHQSTSSTQPSSSSSSSSMAYAMAAAAM